MQSQAGSIIKRGRQYTIVYRMPNGKQKWVSGFSSKAAARAELNETLASMQKGAYIESKTATFADFAEGYIAMRTSIRGSTSSAYASIIRKHLIPYFGEVKLQDIRLDTVQQFVVEISSTMATKTLRNVVTLLRVMLASQKGTSAIKLGYLRYDPLQGVEIPTVIPKQIIPPTAEEVWKLIDSASKLNGVAYGIVYLAAFTGMRRGEILALHFDDINWFQQEIIINKALSKSPADDGIHKWMWKLGATKSRKSIRRIGLSENVLKLLASVKQQSSNRSGLIFPRETGCFIDPDYFDEYIFKPVRLAAGLADVRFHDLRHFFASMLIAQGESPKYICDQLGHSSIQVTFDAYGHLFPQAKTEAAEKLDKRMMRAKEKATVSKLLAKPGFEQQDEEIPRFVN
jgi:integrase